MNRPFLCTLALAALLSAAGCRGTSSASSAEAVSCDTLIYARGLKIARCGDYDRVTLRDPWDTLKTRRTYILASRELLSRRPGLGDTLSAQGTLIATPVRRAVIYTSVHSSLAERLGALECIAGVCEPEYITSDRVREAVENHTIADLGNSTAPNVEKIIELGTEAIIASPFENSGYGAAEKLGIPIVEAADYMEAHPLGRTEWIKFYGLLLGCEQRADSIFADVCSRYNSLKEKATGVSSRPSLILEKKWGQTWAVPSGGSYIGCMQRDAGASYIFADIPGENSVHKSFEEVYERGCDADFWLIKYAAAGNLTYADLKAEYQPYENFKAFKCHRIYGCNTLATSYFDDITLRPDLILADFIHIYHPELLPDYKARYYFPLSDE